MNSTKRSRQAAPRPNHQKQISNKRSKNDSELLPSDVLIAIFSQLPAKYVPKARTLCRHCNQLIIANTDYLPKIYLKDISITGDGFDSELLCVKSEHGRRFIKVSFEWLLNTASKMRPSMQVLLRHIVVKSRFAFDHCKVLTDSILDELCQYSTSFGERAGVALIRVDLRKVTANGLVRFLSSANSLFRFVDMNVVMVQQTFLTDSSLAAITGGKLERFHYIGFTLDRQGKNVFDLKHVTGETLKYFAQLTTPLADVMLGYSVRIRPIDIVKFIETWQKNDQSRKLSYLTLSSSSVNYTTVETLLLKSSFETQYLPRDRKFSISHPALVDHTLEISFLTHRYDLNTDYVN